MPISLIFDEPHPDDNDESTVYLPFSVDSSTGKKTPARISPGDFTITRVTGDTLENVIPNVLEQTDYVYKNTWSVTTVYSRNDAAKGNDGKWYVVTEPQGVIGGTNPGTNPGTDWTETTAQYCLVLEMPNIHGTLTVTAQGRVYDTTARIEDTLTSTPKTLEYDTRIRILENIDAPNLYSPGSIYDVRLGFNHPVKKVTPSDFIYSGGFTMPVIYYKDGTHEWNAIKTENIPLTGTPPTGWNGPNDDAVAQFFLMRFDPSNTRTANGPFAIDLKVSNQIVPPNIVQSPSGQAGGQQTTPTILPPTFPTIPTQNMFINEPYTYSFQLGGDTAVPRATVLGRYFTYVSDTDQPFRYTYNPTEKTVTITGTPTELHTEQTWSTYAFYDDADGNSQNVRHTILWNVTHRPCVISPIPDKRIVYNVPFEIPIAISNFPSQVRAEGLLIGASIQKTETGAIIRGVTPSDDILPDPWRPLARSFGHYTIYASNTAGEVNERANYNFTRGNVPDDIGGRTYTVRTGEAFSHTIDLTGDSPVTYADIDETITGVAVTFNQTAQTLVISGTPVSSQVGNNTITVTLRNQAYNAHAPVPADTERTTTITLNIVLGAVPSDVGRTLSATAGVAFSQTITPTSATPIIGFSATESITGVSVSWNSSQQRFTISGTPVYQNVGRNVITVNMTNSAGITTSTIIFNIAAGAAPTTNWGSTTANRWITGRASTVYFPVPSNTVSLTYTITRQIAAYAPTTVTSIPGLTINYNSTQKRLEISGTTTNATTGHSYRQITYSINITLTTTVGRSSPRIGFSRHSSQRFLQHGWGNTGPHIQTISGGLSNYSDSPSRINGINWSDYYRDSTVNTNNGSSGTTYTQSDISVRILEQITVNGTTYNTSFSPFLSTQYIRTEAEGTGNSKYIAIWRIAGGISTPHRGTVVGFFQMDGNADDDDQEDIDGRKYFVITFT